jgi:hypothetical protein
MLVDAKNVKLYQHRTNDKLSQNNADKEDAATTATISSILQDENLVTEHKG